MIAEMIAEMTMRTAQADASARETGGAHEIATPSIVRLIEDVVAAARGNVNTLLTQGEMTDVRPVEMLHQVGKAA